jgi:small neutral amino acid transporter SnatA (MarC family)
MNVARRRFGIWLVFTLMAQMLLGCTDFPSTIPEDSTTTKPLGSPNSDYFSAQATIDSGQSQLLDLSYKATQVSLEMAQAANVAAELTQEFIQRQKLDLDYQATIVSRNITQAAATQQFILRQTQIAMDATAVAQSNAATAAQSAYLVSVSQTAQAQALLDARVAQTDQAVAAMTAYPMTATPFAMTQAALLMQQYDREQQSFADRVVAPILPFLIILVLFLFILLATLFFLRIIPMPWSRRLRITAGNDHSLPMTTVDGVLADHDPGFDSSISYDLALSNPPELSGQKTVCVEIVNPAEPPFAHWIAEVEQQLNDQGGISL